MPRPASKYSRAVDWMAREFANRETFNNAQCVRVYELVGVAFDVPTLTVQGDVYRAWKRIQPLGSK